MSSKRALRKLTFGGTTYLWRVGHRHRRVPSQFVGGYAYVDCTETLSIRIEGARGNLVIEFAPAEGRHVPSGGPSQSGCVAVFIDGEYRGINLHEPGIVRKMIELALERGVDLTKETRVDGWPLFDALLERTNSGVASE